MKTTSQDNNLYNLVRRDICREIFLGTYQDGDLIPPERQLAEKRNVSRVTVRKALGMLEAEGIITRVQGSGTRVSMHYQAHPGELDIITLVAPAQNAFFSRFLDAFEQRAEHEDVLVLFKQKMRSGSLEDCLYKIYDKDLRNVVLWLEDMQLKPETLKKLRGLGMNLVLFDTSMQSAYADAVCLDNASAIRTLYQNLKRKGCRRIGYISWDAPEVSSIREREETYREMLAGDQLQSGQRQLQIYRVPRTYWGNLQALPKEELDKGLSALSACDGILYGVADLAIPFEKRAEMQWQSHKSATIDILPELGTLREGDAIEQDFAGMADEIFRCLQRQNASEGTWESSVQYVKGKEVVYGRGHGN